MELRKGFRADILPKPGGRNRGDWPSINFPGGIHLGGGKGILNLREVRGEKNCQEVCEDRQMS